MSQKIRVVCSVCGSLNVTRDALARWSEPEQKWEVSGELDNTDCDDCGEERDLVDVSLDTIICACPNCDWRGLESFLKPIKDADQRVAPGEPMPNGECPHCGALCHEEEA
jgi:hypothetical protein